MSAPVLVRNLEQLISENNALKGNSAFMRWHFKATTIDEQVLTYQYLEWMAHNDGKSRSDICVLKVRWPHTRVFRTIGFKHENPATCFSNWLAFDRSWSALGVWFVSGFGTYTCCLNCIFRSHCNLHRRKRSEVCCVGTMQSQRYQKANYPKYTSTVCLCTHE